MDIDNIKDAQRIIHSLKKPGLIPTIQAVLGGVKLTALEFINYYGLTVDNFDQNETIEYSEVLQEYHVSGHYSTKDKSLDECKAKSIILDLNAGFIFIDTQLCRIQKHFGTEITTLVNKGLIV